MSTADPVDGPVVFDPADFGAIPKSKELRRWMRKVRRGKADRSVWQQFEDIYVVIFALAFVYARYEEQRSPHNAKADEAARDLLTDDEPPSKG